MATTNKIRYWLLVSASDIRYARLGAVVDGRGELINVSTIEEYPSSAVVSCCDGRTRLCDVDQLDCTGLLLSPRAVDVFEKFKLPDHRFIDIHVKSEMNEILGTRRLLLASYLDCYADNEYFTANDCRVRASAVEGLDYVDAGNIIVSDPLRCALETLEINVEFRQCIMK